MCLMWSFLKALSILRESSRIIRWVPLSESSYQQTSQVSQTFSWQDHKMEFQWLVLLNWHVWLDDVPHVVVVIPVLLPLQPLLSDLRELAGILQVVVPVKIKISSTDFLSRANPQASFRKTLSHNKSNKTGDKVEGLMIGVGIKEI